MRSTAGVPDCLVRLFAVLLLVVVATLGPAARAADATNVPVAPAVVSGAWLQASLGSKDLVLLDVRAEEAWAAGHIPGAKNRLWKRDVDGGSFRPEAVTRAELEAVGVSWEKPVVVYCNSGHQASEGFYTLKLRLGPPDVRLYQGSWLEWSMTPGTPRETSAPAEPK